MHFIQILKLTSSLILLQLIIIYYPLLFIKNKKLFLKLLPFRLVDVIIFWIYLNLILVLLNFIDKDMFVTNILNIKFVLLYIFYAILYAVYFFIIQPLILLSQKKRYIDINSVLDISKITNKYSNIKILVTKYPYLNAFAIGLPFNKVIIIGNELISSLLEEEIKAIIYHEIGHHKNYDLVKYFIFNIIAISLFPIGLILFNNMIIFYLKINVSNENISAIYGAIYGAIFICTILSIISYKAEYKADTFAAIRIGKSTMINALNKINLLLDNNMKNGSITHPNLSKRIKNIENSNEIIL